ncbi:IucA/IucC family siderophore biosynthesis protein [Chryseobacterium indologenes]|uniref:IucA/IucC family protein n=1 Tax=Chryseobacterium indologenes TaxID=253 RepID=UPI000F4F3636|nr:IucA/IucC family siderophore biosynthesis protein [Chryseobacterium indologenes]AYZ35755.1 IucA/IucC family siderophore biosynthesis protein [Chryseobacterium indologenes]MEB4759519.1 IucA/IucC family siderophore biosynthesis protein [Chryseobacterium indologenes]
MNTHLEYTISQENWNEANRNLMAKTIAELMHEELLKPVATFQDDEDFTVFTLETGVEAIQYTFRGQERMMDYWHIDKDSITRMENGEKQPVVDVAAFFLDMQSVFDLDPYTIARYTEELLHTLYCDAMILAKGTMTSQDLAASDYQTIEHHMTGHPWVIVNKSRLGFSPRDLQAFAPESDQNLKVLWLAAHRSRSAFQSLDSIDREDFYRSEIGPELFDQFKQKLTAQGKSVEDYHFIPVHPWQWEHKLKIHFAGDIASGLLIRLGEGNDLYSPQQSIRTLFNADHPEKRYLKTAVSILSTGNIRGLSPKQMKIAPAITAWVKSLIKGDTYLDHKGTIFLGEEASIAYLHPQYGAIANVPYQYNEFLGALWRESAENYLESDEEMVTMASLLYVDKNGTPLVQAFAEKAGMTIREWITQYLDAYLTPLLHIYYTHSLCVTPHGENIMVVLKNGVPQRIVIKDFVDDIVLTTEAKEKLPAHLADGLIQSSNKENVPLFILLGVFDAFFRYLSNVLHTYSEFEEETFWTLVHDCIESYKNDNPHLQERYAKYDLYVPAFKRFYINSLRLKNNGYSENKAFAIPRKDGALPNPLHQITNKNSVAAL